MVSVREEHTILRKAILGGEISITMPIGFALSPPRNTSFTSAIDRNHSCRESMTAVTSDVSSITLMGDIGETVDTGEKVGVIITGDAQRGSKGMHRCRPISLEQRMFTATEPMSVKLFVRKAAGYHPMTGDTAVIGDNTYFPLNTIHALINYVCVFPLTGNVIGVRYYNGVMPELFLDIRNTIQN